MYILALESTGPHASVAIIDENGAVKELNNDGTLNHLENLIPMVDSLLKSEGIGIDEIEKVAVSVGPGSFTGIRIGVTTARSLCQNLGIPGIPVPTLESFAYAVPGFDGIICPMIDARRNQIYGGAFKWNEGIVEDIIPAGPYMIDEFLEKLEGRTEKVMFFADGVKKFGEKIFGTELDAKLAPEDIRLQHASYVAKMAMDMKEEVSFDELHPEYMRQAEAERKREEKLKNGTADR